MKNSLARKQNVNIVCGEQIVALTLLPLTFRRLIDVNFALQSEELGQALSRPTPMNIAKIAYCLLDENSLQLIDQFKIEVNGELEESNPMHKLFCMMCENNLNDGFTNYTSVLNAVSRAAAESLPECQDKKKALRLLNPFKMSLKKFLT